MKPTTQPGNTVTEVTLRAIIDYLSLGRYWSGELQEDEFLGRLCDLKRMPSQLEGNVTVLNNLGSIGHELAELRNQFGTGHERSIDHGVLPNRHAKLAIGADSALAVFLYTCHDTNWRI